MKPIQINQAAFVSVDNTRTFEDKSLNELYVSEGEQAARGSKEASDMCATFGMTLVNVLEKHPKGHVSFASSYQDKKPRETITRDEVQDRTEEDNGLSDKATFTVDELKSFLSEKKSQTLWPDHAVNETQGVELMEPLAEELFDLTVVKGTKSGREAYSGFDGTTLDEELKSRNINQIFIWWVATDYCVGNTAKDAVDLKYDVYLVTEAIRGVEKATSDAMLDILKSNGVKSITLSELEDLLQKSL